MGSTAMTMTTTMTTSCETVCVWGEGLGVCVWIRENINQKIRDKAECFLL